MRLQQEKPGFKHPERPDRLIYLLRQGPLYATDAALQLQAFGYTVAIAEDLPQLVAMMTGRTPVAVIIDSPDSGVIFTPEEAEQIRLSSNGAVPILLLSPNRNLDARLAAARVRAEGFFIKPVDMAQLAERLETLIALKGKNPSRVLIVCSDQNGAAAYQGIVTMAGMEAVCSRRPGDILGLMEQFGPDAVLVDVDTPGCSATDLVALVRQDPAFTDIPVIMLSSNDAPEMRRSALESGADEFLPKASAPEELLFLLSSRVERYRGLRELIMRDRLTNLYNHTAFKEQLLREIARARREDKPLALAMVDLDFFKKINDSHGHPAGDQVIRSVAFLMRQRFRHCDSVGRYGGEEFGVIMPGTTGLDAVKVLNEVREEFQRQRHQGADTTFCATLSVGVAEFYGRSDTHDHMSLICAADAALYRSKHLGRNRVELAQR